MPAKQDNLVWCSNCGDAPRAPNHSYCRACRNEYQSVYRKYRYKNEPDYRRGIKQASRTRLYGVSDEQYTEMWARQGGVCAICLCDEVDGRELGVDHNHETGGVRGLLCANCNGALGMFKERGDLMKRALEYLAIFDN